MLDEATRHSEELRRSAAAEAERLRQSADEVLAAARAESETRLREAAEQTEWASTTVRAVLDGAAGEADAIRRAGHADAASHTRAVRHRLQGVIAAIAGRMALELAESRQRADDLARVAELATAEAESEATATRERAEAEAARIVADATDESERAVVRLERRRAEAESGAASLRALVAEEVTRSRAEAAEDRRRAREESLTLVTEGRAEADQLREGARRALERARAEIAQLQSQRDGIAAELGQLSGVIEALSVPEREPTTGSGDPTPTAEPPHPQENSDA